MKTKFAALSLPIVGVIALIYFLFFYVLFDHAAFQLLAGSGKPSSEETVRRLMALVIALSGIMAAFVLSLELLLLVRYRSKFVFWNVVQAPLLLFIMYFILSSDSYIPILSD